MKNILTYFRHRYSYFLPFPDNKIWAANYNVIPITTCFYSFIGSHVSTKYIPSETEIVGISGNQAINRVSGEKEVVYNYRKEQVGVNIRIREIYNKSRSIWVWVASTAIILIFAVAIVNNKIRNFQIDTAYKTYFANPDIAFIKPQINGKEYISQWESIEKAFNRRQLSFVRAQFRSITVSSPIYEYVKLLKGICLMHENQFKSAYDCFMSLGANSSYSSMVRWYSALCSLKLGDIQSARFSLQNINDNTIYSKKASEMLYYLKEVN